MKCRRAGRQNLQLYVRSFVESQGCSIWRPLEVRADLRVLQVHFIALLRDAFRLSVCFLNSECVHLCSASMSEVNKEKLKSFYPPARALRLILSYHEAQRLKHHVDCWLHSFGRQLHHLNG